MGEFGDYFKTWNWEMGFRYFRNEGQDLSVGEVSQPGLRDVYWIQIRLRSSPDLSLLERGDRFFLGEGENEGGKQHGRLSKPLVLRARRFRSNPTGPPSR